MTQKQAKHGDTETIRSAHAKCWASAEGTLLPSHSHTSSAQSCSASRASVSGAGWTARSRRAGAQTQAGLPSGGGVSSRGGADTKMPGPDKNRLHMQHGLHLPCERLQDRLDKVDMKQAQVFLVAFRKWVIKKTERLFYSPRASCAELLAAAAVASLAVQPSVQHFCEAGGDPVPFCCAGRRATLGTAMPRPFWPDRDH